MYRQVWVPLEVGEELAPGGAAKFALAEYQAAVTGSIGILLRAKSEGRPFSMRQAIDRMQARGIWLSDRVIAFALAQAAHPSARSGRRLEPEILLVDESLA